MRDVAASSPLYDEGVAEGDLIVEVNGQPAPNVREFERLVGGAPSGSFLRLYLRRVSPHDPSSRPVEFLRHRARAMSQREARQLR